MAGFIFHSKVSLKTHLSFYSFLVSSDIFLLEALGRCRCYATAAESNGAAAAKHQQQEQEQQLFVASAEQLGASVMCLPL